MARYSPSIQNLISQLSSLPGIGGKSAQRLAFHILAMDEKDAKAILEKIDYIDMIRGSYELKCLDSETTARANARRSLVAACDIKSGDTITKEMLTYKRPGTGISATDYDIIVGKTAACDIKEDTVLKWDMIK